jgi:hypothetical protein
MAAALTCGSACESSRGAAPPPAAANAQPTCPGDDAALALSGVRERLEAEHRARDARQEADQLRGQCDLVQHEFDEVRSRDAFEDSVWYRLSQSEIDAQGLREAATGAPPARRAALAAMLRTVEQTLDTVEHSIRRVRSVPGSEWPRYVHDIDAALREADRALRDAR